MSDESFNKFMLLALENKAPSKADAILAIRAKYGLGLVEAKRVFDAAQAHNEAHKLSDALDLTSYNAFVDLITKSMNKGAF